VWRTKSYGRHGLPAPIGNWKIGTKYIGSQEYLEIFRAQVCATLHSGTVTGSMLVIVKQIGTQ